MTCPLSPRLWWQKYVAGSLKTPQAIYREAVNELPSPAVASDRFFDLPEDGPTWDAPERLKSPQWFRTSGHMSQQERADWSHVDPRIRTWAAMVILAAAKRDIPLYVHTALRDEAEQTRVLKAGHSKAKYPRSAHNIGEAVDIVHGIFHWDMSVKEWALVHALGRLCLDRFNAQLPKAEKLELTWGGNFKTLYDPAHWEVSDYRSRIRELPPVEPLHLTPAAIRKLWRQGA